LTKTSPLERNPDRTKIAPTDHHVRIVNVTCPPDSDAMTDLSKAVAVDSEPQLHPLNHRNFAVEIALSLAEAVDEGVEEDPEAEEEDAEVEDSIDLENASSTDILAVRGLELNPQRSVKVVAHITGATPRTI